MKKKRQSMFERWFFMQFPSYRDVAKHEKKEPESVLRNRIHDLKNEVESIEYRLRELDRYQRAREVALLAWQAREGWKS